MSARHGTKYGYQKGCRHDCCTRANTKALKLWRAGLTSTLVDATGTKRRIQALVSLGWTLHEISTEAGGYTKNWAHLLLKQDTVTSTTAAKVDAVFERLSMTVPIGPYRNRTRNRAARNGWLPPLAYDNIDDPDEQPTDWHYRDPDRADLLADLVEQGAGITEACTRLKVSRDTLERWCARNGHSGLYSQLVAREYVHRENNNQHTVGVSA
jgi:lambda repressor-like predicted transcriptional regulator